MEVTTSQVHMKQPQSQSQPQLPADDWSFLDGVLDWEALLDETNLDTFVNSTPQNLSQHAMSGTTGSQRSQVCASQGQRCCAHITGANWRNRNSGEHCRHVIPLQC